MVPPRSAQGQFLFREDYSNPNIPLTRFRVQMLISGSGTPSSSAHTSRTVIRSPGELDDEADYIALRLVTIEEPDHSSGVAIQVEVSFVDEHGKRQKAHMHWLATALNYFKEKPDVESWLSVSETSIADDNKSNFLLRWFRRLSNPNSEKIISVSIQQPKSIEASNLFTCNNAFGTQTDAINQIRAELSGDQPVYLLSTNLIVLSKLDKVKSQIPQQVLWGFHERWLDPNSSRSNDGERKVELGISGAGLRTLETTPPAPGSYHKLAKLSYASPQEFLMTSVLALEKEHELDRQKPNVMSNVRALFFEIAHDASHMRCILALPKALSKDDRDEEVKLKQKDIFHLDVGST